MNVNTSLAAALVLLLAGCSTTMKATTVDSETGRFSTSNSLKPEEVITQEPFKAEHAELLYVKTDSKSADYNDFFVKSFMQMKPYKVVLDQAGLEALVIERSLTDRVSGISDLVALNRLAREIGPFLIVEPTAEWKGGYNFSSTIKATDAMTGKAVLDIRRNAFNWAGLDKPLFYPMLNAFADWSEGKPVATAASAK